MTDFSGDAGNNSITGTAGNDFIDGREGNDTLNGAGGNDILVGGPGADILTGGTGADIFRGSAAELNGDRIIDFLIGDRIQILDLGLADAQGIHTEGNNLVFNGGSLQIDNLGPGRLVLRAITGGGIEVRLQSPSHNDFNGDGQSDIFWRNDSGAFSSWLGSTNGGYINNDAAAAGFVSVDWHIAGTGDFDGDGRVDLLWRNDNGSLSNWLGKSNGGFASNDSVAASFAPTSWHVIGTADFNGDGHADILWRNDNGAISNWLGAAGGAFTNNDNVAAGWAPTSWHVVGTGDFNGDGLDDLLWRNDNGALSDWLGTANGGFVNNDVNAAGWAPTNWQVAATGDFNGDGQFDILWRSDSGALSNWLGTATGGFTNNDAKAAGYAPTDWHVMSVGDYDGDGIDDLLWRNDSGAFSNWLGRADGSFVNNDAHAAGYASTSWHIQDPFF